MSDRKVASITNEMSTSGALNHGLTQRPTERRYSKTKKLGIGATKSVCMSLEVSLGYQKFVELAAKFAEEPAGYAWIMTTLPTNFADGCANHAIRLLV